MNLDFTNMTPEMLRVLDFFLGEDITWKTGYAEHSQTREICCQFEKDGVLLKTGSNSFLLHPRYIDIHRLHAWLDEGCHVGDTLNAYNSCRYSSSPMDKP